MAPSLPLSARNPSLRSPGPSPVSLGATLRSQSHSPEVLSIVKG